VNVRDRISRLETLLQRIQSHSRARRSAALGERRVVRESYTTDVESQPAKLEVVESEPLEAISEEDVVEMSSDVLESVPPPPMVAAAPPAAVPSAPPRARTPPPPPAEIFDGEPLSEPDFEEEAPASSKRHRIAGTIDEAVSAAARERVVIEEGREVPVKTPPPESGPQEAPPPPGSLAPAAAPDISELLDELPLEAPTDVPRPEQLGETIELSEPVGPPLELDSRKARTPPPPPIAEELEVTLPLRKYAGNYDDALMPPPEAKDELLEHRRKSGEILMPEPARELRSKSPLETTTAPVPSAEESSPAPSQVTVRSSLSGLSAAVYSDSSVRSQAPKSFLDLLDESVRLGGS
jgi:hypothetical protein